MTYWHPGMCRQMELGEIRGRWSMKRFPHPVTLDWYRRPSMERWDEICAWTLRQFGMPGIRYQTEVSSQRMTWYFADKSDQFVMILAWGNDHEPNI